MNTPLDPNSPATLADAQDMTPATHTPGPWISEVGFFPKLGRRLGVIRENHALGGNEPAICAVSTVDETSPEDEANARLIAAAPDLLHSLETLFGWIEDGTLVRDIGKDGDVGFAMKMMGFVRELGKAQLTIAKAKGAK